MPTKPPSPALETHFFESPKDFNAWLKKNHDTSPGIWLKFYKKASGKKTMVYAEALDEALCYGWIDSQAKSLDEESYLQKFTPRRSKSIWSKNNREKIDRLIKEKRMTKFGLAEVERAKADGRWDAAYDSLKTMVLPEDFLKELSKNQKAKQFFETLDKQNQYAISWRLQTAKKSETRAKRLKEILAKMEREEKFH